MTQPSRCHSCSATFCCLTSGPWVPPELRGPREEEEEPIEFFDLSRCIDYWEMKYGVGKNWRMNPRSLWAYSRLALYTSPPSRK